jgi:hypothetical protein
MHPIYKLLLINWLSKSATSLSILTDAQAKAFVDKNPKGGVCIGQTPPTYTIMEKIIYIWF